MNHLRVIMKLKKVARARALDALAATMAPKQPSSGTKYTIWKFIFQGKVVKTHQSPKENATNIGNLPQIVGSSNNPNKLHNKGLLAIKRHARQAPQTQKAHGMCKLPTKPRLVSRLFLSRLLMQTQNLFLERNLSICDL